MRLTEKSTAKVLSLITRLKMLLPPDEYQAWLQQLKSRLDEEFDQR